MRAGEDSETDTQRNEMIGKIIISLLALTVVALTARALINPAVVSNTAITPTLEKGDVILINRAERFANKPLNRFELVAIVPPFVNGKHYELDESPSAMIADLTGLPVGEAPVIDVRRVIALPGETIVVRKDLGIFIDGKLLDESSYTKDLPDSDLFVVADIMRQSAFTGLIQSYDNGDAPIVVPPNFVFVLPDNRTEYPGSDKWGFLSQKRVLGKIPYRVSEKGLVEIKTPTLAFAPDKIAINDDGVRALEKGDFADAIQLFKSALAIDNNFELARDNLSIAYNNLAIKSASQPRVALDSLHKALFLDPDNELTKKNLAGILERLGKNAGKFEDRIALAEEASNEGKAISALVEYRAAVKLKPSPTILAKVSQLEKKCDFPAHAIPEDLAETPVRTTTAKAASTVPTKPASTVQTDQAAEVQTKQTSKVQTMPTSSQKLKKQIDAPKPEAYRGPPLKVQTP